MMVPETIDLGDRIALLGDNCTDNCSGNFSLLSR